jgi:hypothetical protein
MMRMKFEFKTKMEAIEYLEKRGWVPWTQNCSLTPIFEHPNSKSLRMVHKIYSKWYIGQLGA